MVIHVTDEYGLAVGVLGGDVLLPCIIACKISISDEHSASQLVVQLLQIEWYARGARRNLGVSQSTRLDIQKQRQSVMYMMQRT